MNAWSPGSSESTWPAATHVAARRTGGFLSRLWAGTAEPRPWGEDLVEQSLSTLFYPSRWDDVGRDELVFLLPSLARGSRAAQPSETTPPETTLAETTPSKTSPAGAAPFFREALAEWTLRSADAPDPTAARRILAILETLHRLAAGDADDRMPTTAEAMTGSLHARVNAAYADPRLDHLAEPLMVAAWLGHLAAGRNALLPPMIAAPLAALIAGGLSSSSSRPDPAGTVIVRHAAAAGGAARLGRFAAKVCRSGRPRLVRSTAPPGPFAWDRAAVRPATLSRSGD